MRRENDASREPLLFMLGMLRSILKEVTAGHRGALWEAAHPWVQLLLPLKKGATCRLRRLVPRPRSPARGHSACLSFTGPPGLAPGPSALRN